MVHDQVCVAFNRYDHGDITGAVIKRFKQTVGIRNVQKILNYMRLMVSEVFKISIPILCKSPKMLYHGAIM